MNLGDIFTADFWVSLWRDYGEHLSTATTRILVIILAYIVVRFVIFRLIRRLTYVELAGVTEGVLRAREARVRALQSVLKSAAGFVLGFVAVVMILQAAGLNIVPLLTTASVAGLAVGFGAQKLVRDVISGFFILMEDQYGVGDYVTIGDITGVVQDLEMRTTRIRDKLGVLHTLSNGDITKVSNHSRGPIHAVFDVPLRADSDIDKATSVLAEIGRSLADEHPHLVKEPLACEGLAQMSGATTTVRLTGTIMPGRQEEVQMLLLDAVRQMFPANDLRLA